ncbi:hypothetical protein OEZ85_010940 [Tetradesmus obliquus]|uniref:Guanylate cyclase domain-containing protein n=1 Tax=Tetradesmus obliquus TaxID=3088 RepID=A0ABY8TSN5_TETOB|nr:hypothetical protein OEZ85_010940 [Tetradesmus obliquus]
MPPTFARASSCDEQQQQTDSRVGLVAQAFLLALSQSTFRGVWAATVVWLCLLLLLEVLVVGTAPLWLYTPGGSSSMHSLPWSIWVAMGLVAWLGSTWLLGQVQQQGCMHQSALVTRLLDSSPIDQAVAGVRLGSEPGLLLACVSSGSEALEAVFGGKWLPDLVLMDVALHDAPASEVAGQMRAAFSPLELPIMLLASRSGEAQALAALEAGVMIKQSVRRKAEARSHHELLVQVLPPHIIQRLAAGQAYIPEQHEQVTILFSDIVCFTELCSLWPTAEVVALLDVLFSAFDDLCDKHGVFKVETGGDAYMAVAGHDGAPDHTLRMAAMAVDMLAAAEEVQHQVLAQGKDGRRVQIRIGMHTGPALSGVVGKRRPRYCFFGGSVNTASRMESSGYPMTVHLSDACAAALAAAATAAAASGDVVDYRMNGVLQLVPAGDAAQELECSSSSGCGGPPGELLDIGVRHVKGKGMMRTHLLKAGDWEDALDAARIQHARQELLHDSSTCSTGSPFSMRGSPPPAAEAAGSYCYSDIIGPAPGVAVQLTAVYPSRSSLNISPGSWSVGSVGSPNAAVAGLAEADAAMTVDCAGGVLLGKVLEGELAARRCSSAYPGPSAAAAVGGLTFS